MKKIILMLALFAASFIANAQVGIGTTNPEGALDVVSSNSGVIVPRVANVAAVTVPVNGMIIYDISSKCIKGYENNAWTECLSFAGPNPSTNGTGVVSSFGAPSCTANTINGTLTEGVPVSGVTMSLYANVTTLGTYDITAGPTNGITFTGSGTFTALGCQLVTLTATGTPTAAGTHTFVTNTTPSASVSGTTLAPLAVAPTNPLGAGSFSGKTCFDIALGNDDTNSCGPLSARTVNQSDFTNVATHTQSYTFRPVSTVSNVRFMYINTNGTPIIAISGDDASNNISTPVVATVNYSTSLNTDASELASAAALTGDIYVVYNNTADNTGSDLQLKLTANVKDCACCGAYISPTEWKEFLCHNLGADTSVDPHVPVIGLHGAYTIWGSRGPNVTGDSRVDWLTPFNSGPLGFVAAPIPSNENFNVPIPNWTAPQKPANAWRTANGVKTENDPCPGGYRVPTETEWLGVLSNNSASKTGTFLGGRTEYGSAQHYGPNASTKTLTLPAVGYANANASYGQRGYAGYYWSSTQASNLSRVFIFHATSSGYMTNFGLTSAAAVRCIAE